MFPLLTSPGPDLTRIAVSLQSSNRRVRPRLVWRNGTLLASPVAHGVTGHFSSTLCDTFQGADGHDGNAGGVGDALGGRDTDAQACVGARTDAHGHTVKVFDGASALFQRFFNEGQEVFGVVVATGLLFQADDFFASRQGHGTYVGGGFDV